METDHSLWKMYERGACRTIPSLPCYSKSGEEMDCHVTLLCPPPLAGWRFHWLFPGRVTLPFIPKESAPLVTVALLALIVGSQFALGMGVTQGCPEFHTYSCLAAGTQPPSQAS